MIALNPAKPMPGPGLGQATSPNTPPPISTIDPRMKVFETLYLNRTIVPWAMGIAFVIVGGLLRLVPNPFEAKSFFHTKKLLAFGIGVGSGFIAKSWIEQVYQNQVGSIGPPAPKG